MLHIDSNRYADSLFRASFTWIRRAHPYRIGWKGKTATSPTPSLRWAVKRRPSGARSVYGRSRTPSLGESFQSELRNPISTSKSVRTQRLILSARSASTATRARTLRNSSHEPVVESLPSDAPRQSVPLRAARLMSLQTSSSYVLLLRDERWTARLMQYSPTRSCRKRQTSMLDDNSRGPKKRRTVRASSTLIKLCSTSCACPFSTSLLGGAISCTSRNRLYL